MLSYAKGRVVFDNLRKRGHFLWVGRCSFFSSPALKSDHRVLDLRVVCVSVCVYGGVHGGEAGGGAGILSMYAYGSWDFVLTYNTYRGYFVRGKFCP